MPPTNTNNNTSSTYAPMRIGGDSTHPVLNNYNTSNGWYYNFSNWWNSGFQPLSSSSNSYLEEGTINNNNGKNIHLNKNTSTKRNWIRICCTVILLFGITLLLMIVLFGGENDTTQSSSSSSDNNEEEQIHKHDITNNNNDDLNPTSTSTTTTTTTNPTDDSYDDNNINKDSTKNKPTNLDDHISLTLESLEDYYSNHDLVLQGFGGDTRAKFVASLIDTLANKIAIGFQNKKPFTIAAVGSSWIAGYGNCKTDRYLTQIYNVLQPIFLLGGSSLVIEEHPIGFWCGTSPIAALSDFVMNDDGPESIDEIHFAFPTEEIGLDHNNIQRHRDFLSRLAMKSSFKFIIESNCPNSNADNKSPNSKFLLDNNQQHGVLCLNTILDNLSLQKRGWGAISNPPFDYTRIHNSQKSSKTNKDGILYRNWRPGPLGHQIVADTFVMLHLKAMKRALEFISKSSSQGNVNGGDKSSLFVLTLSPQTPHVENMVNLDKSWKIMNHGPLPSLDEVPIQQQHDKSCTFTNNEIDSCPGYFQTSRGSNGKLQFSFTIPSNVKTSKVYLCCCCNGELCVGEQFGNGKTVSIMMDNKEIDVRNGIDSRLEECLVINNQVNSGDHQVIVTTLSSTANNNNNNKEIKLSRLVVIGE
jgi:hypothetical protein